VLRHGDGLDQDLERFIARGLASVQPMVLEVLRLGAYQLRHLERVPPHAAVATSVALAREAVHEKVTGFVNAVLRKVAELDHERTARDPNADEIEQLATAWSHPAWLVARWVRWYGADATEALLEWNNSQPALVVQPVRVDQGELERRFAAAGVNAFAAPFGAGLVVDATRPESLPGYAEGDFYVQDPAQALVLRYSDFPAEAIVYDACAAPGGKTLGLGQRVARVISADASRRRMVRLRENLARAGSGREIPLVADALHPPIRPQRAILLDAPCLGTGTFARHPDARLRVKPEALQRLAAEQAALLDAAADRLLPGGVLVYATCSLEPEEDEAQVDRFLARHPDFRRQPPAEFPRELLTEDGDLLILPHRDGMDGAYAARLVRRG
jgi:16S rRNA (cytosine967-C5)-methyltransferase